MAYPQIPVFDAAVAFARTEGLLSAPESAHAAMDLAGEAREAGEGRVILFNLSGHGHFDLAAYEAYVAGHLENYEYATEEVREALASLPRV